MARRNGITVREFGVGFPPRFAKITYNKIIYSLNALPLGGFVRIKGEDGQEKGNDSFATQSAWVKTKVLLAGVSVNLVFAYVVMVFLLGTGVANIFPFTLPNSGFMSQRGDTVSRLQVVDVVPGSAADHAGLKLGNVITAINGTELASSEQLRDLTKSLHGQTVQIIYSQGDSEKSATVKLGDNQTQGYLGVATNQENRIHYSWIAAPFAAAVVTVKLAWSTLAAFGGLITGLVTRLHVSDQVTGPIGITAAVPRVSAFGIDYLLLLLTQISLSLAIVNALPISPLDGGKAVLVWLRALGLKITRRTELATQLIGFGLLIGLVVIITISDIVRLR